MNYEKNIKYFSEPPTVSPGIGAIVICVIIGLALCAIGNAITVILGILVIGAVIWFRISSQNKVSKFIADTPSDGDIDKAAANCLQNLRVKALKKLNLENEEISSAPPIEFWGYDYRRKMPCGADAAFTEYGKMGKDSLRRMPVVAMYGFYFSAQAIHYYSSYISLVADKSEESTEEYFYENIVSVKTSTAEESLGDSGKIKFDVFSLLNTGGESLGCSVRNSEDADKAVNAMRSLLKERKKR